MPQLQEDPFMQAAWTFVAAHRRLRRNFRELSQSRASAVRRMQDYQELADRLIEAAEGLGECQSDDAAYPLYQRIVAIRDYRRSQLSAGWR